MSDATLSALSNIRTKIRRLTRNPSEAQLSTAELDNYINNFILYDFPAHVKLDSLETMLTFYTTANQEKYRTNTIDADDPLYNFKNKYTNVGSPIYIAGNKVSFSQSRDEFYSIYPLTNTKIDIGTGDGIETSFTGTLDSTPILQNNVTVTSTDTGGDRLLLTDDGESNFEGDIGAASTIWYLSGVYDLTFTFSPEDGETVWIQTVPYVAGKPVSVLFFEDEFVLRPVPDSSYRVDVSVRVRPTELTDSADLPELSEWWQFISLGSSVKILQDRLDMETAQLLMPEFKNQEILINRRSIVQNSGKRAATIFTQGYGIKSGYKGE